MDSLYERDFYAWTQEQAASMRAGRLADIDVVHLAEEIESMGARAVPVSRHDRCCRHVNPGVTSRVASTLSGKDRRHSLGVEAGDQHRDRIAGSPTRWVSGRRIAVLGGHCPQGVRALRGERAPKEGKIPQPV